MSGHWAARYELSGRAYGALDNAGVTSAAAARKIPYEEWMRLPNCSTRTVNELNAVFGPFPRLRPAAAVRTPKQDAASALRRAAEALEDALGKIKLALETL